MQSVNAGMSILVRALTRWILVCVVVTCNILIGCFLQVSSEPSQITPIPPSPDVIRSAGQKPSDCRVSPVGVQAASL